MDFLSYSRKIQILRELVKKKATGTPTALSKKLGVSERTVYRLLDCLKAEGFELKYDRHRQSYFEASEK